MLGITMTEQDAVPPGPADDVQLARLRDALMRLHLATGEPSTRDIARLTGHKISHTTVNAVLRCKRLPRAAHIEHVVRALHGDVEEFHRLWVAARLGEPGTGQGVSDEAPGLAEDPPPSGPGSAVDTALDVQLGSPPPRQTAPGTAVHVHGQLQAAPDLDLVQVPMVVRAGRPSTAEGFRVVGRGQESDRLVDLALSGTRGVEVLVGPGGCGKTTVAGEVATKVSAADRSIRVWWVEASERTALIQTMLAVAAGLGVHHDVIQRAYEGDSIEPAWQILEAAGSYNVIVIDGVDDRAMLAGPGGLRQELSRVNGLIIVTSRVADLSIWGTDSHITHVERLPLDDSTSLILDRELEYATEAIADADVRKAQAVAEHLGGMPLALHLAGCYLRDPVVDETPEGYLALLAWRSARPVNTTGEPGAAAASADLADQLWNTIEVSLEALESKGFSHARALLRLLSTCAFGRPVPVRMLLIPDAMCGTGLLRCSATEIEDSVYHSLRGLIRLGLVTEARGEAAAAVEIHRQLAEVSVTRLMDGHEDARIVLRAAATAVHLQCMRLAPSSPDDWSVWQMLIPHVMAMLDRLQDVDDATTRIAAVRAADRTFRHLRCFGRHTAAERLVERALDEATPLGADHPDLLTARHNFSLARQAAGDLRNAELVLREVLDRRTLNQGSDHVDALSARHDLALVLEMQGKFADAERLLQQVATSRVRALGPDHPETLSTQHSLALVHFTLGAYGKAEHILIDVLQARESKLGSDHVDTIATRHSLAYLRQAQGDLNGAEVLFRTVGDLRLQKLGPTHPNTLMTMHNLAWIHHARADHRRSVAELREVLRQQTRRLGDDHGHSLSTKANLAWVLQGLGRLDEASGLFENVLEHRTRRLGEYHPDTLTTQSNLALVRHAQGHLQEAEAMLRSVGARRSAIYGPDHPRTLITRHNIALVLVSLGRTRQAESILREVLDKQTAALGDGHPSTVATRHNLGLVLKANGDPTAQKDLRVPRQRLSSEAVAESTPATGTTD